MTNQKNIDWRRSYLALVGALIRRRIELCLTQQQVADRLGKARRTYQRWEDGTTTPDADELFQWAALLGVEIASKMTQREAA